MVENMQVNPVYLTSFIIYMVVVLLIGMWAYRRTHDVMDFWVFGQKMGPVLASFSLITTFVSAVSVLGFTGAVYADGYNLMTHTLLGLMMGLAALYTVVGYVRTLNVLTFPDLVARVTGYQMARPLCGFVLLLSGWLYLIMQLVGAGLIVTFITGVPYEYMVWVIGGVFIVYTVMGGLVSVTWTDLLQGILMIAAVVAVVVYMTIDQGGITAINESFGAMDPANVHPTGLGKLSIPVVGATFLAFFGTILTEQDMLIRIAATRDVKTAKIHIAAAGVVLSIFYCFLVILGGAATVALANAGIPVSVPDALIPTLMTQYLPTGLSIFIILAVMSAILSTTDTRLHACGMTVARDIYSYFRPQVGERDLMLVSRIATVILGITATAAAVNPPGTIIFLYGFRAVFLTSAFLVPVYFAVFRSDADGRAVIAAIAGGGVVGLATHIMGGGITLSFLGLERLGLIPSTFLGVGTATALVLIGNRLLKGRTRRAVA